MANEKPTESLNADSFDRLVGKPEKIWGAARIAEAIGKSVDTVRELAFVEGVPIYKPLGTGYFAYRSELERWLRTKPTSAAQAIENTDSE